MAVGISEKLRQRAREKIDVGEGAYRKLILLAARGQKHDLALLADAAEALELNAEDVDGDLAAIREHDKLRAGVAKWDGKKAELEKATNIREELEKLNEQRTRLLTQQQNAIATQSMIAATDAAIAKLEREHRRIWPAK